MAIRSVKRFLPFSIRTVQTWHSSLHTIHSERTGWYRVWKAVAVHSLVIVRSVQWASKPFTHTSAPGARPKYYWCFLLILLWCLCFRRVCIGDQTHWPGAWSTCRQPRQEEHALFCKWPFTTIMAQSLLFILLAYHTIQSDKMKSLLT